MKNNLIRFLFGDLFTGRVALLRSASLFLILTAGASHGADVVVSLPVAPTVSTGAASTVAQTTATLGGTVNANSGSSTVAFQYGLTASYGSTIAATPSPVTGSTAVTVSAAVAGLSPNTTYHFRVTGTNSGRGLSTARTRRS